MADTDENAPAGGGRSAVVDVGDGLAVAFAIAAHDPVAAPGTDTAVATVAADLRAAGAEPLAVLDAVHVGPWDADATVDLLPRLVAGLAADARRLDLPGLGGLLVADEVYADAPLAHAVAVGVVDPEATTTPPAAPPAAGAMPPPARPGWIDRVNADRAEDLPRATTGDGLGEQVLRLAGSPALADRAWASEQYDRYVRGDTVLSAPEGVGLVRLDAGTGRGAALAVTGNPRFALLNPYLGAQLALAEGVRRVAAAGAEPRAALACLDAGHADAPAAAWQRDEMRLGLVDAADRLGLTLPAACGRLHDRAGGAALHPTPVVATLGTLDDVATRTPGGFAHPGDAVVLLGRTGAELSGSAWADAVHGHLGGMPPFPDPAAEAALAGVLVDAARAGILSSARALAAGGLAQTLVEAALRHDLGVSLTLPEGDPTVTLFSESPARALVSVSGQHYDALRRSCAAAGVPVTRLGEVLEQPALEVLGQFTLGLADLRAAWGTPLRAAMEG